MKASDLLVKSLENEGVEYIFGIPGEENLDFLESLRGSKIKLVVTRHEQGAGFMAATYGRLTGKAGVCLSTLGPGATNFFTPAAYAHLGAMPMLMLTGQKPIHKSKQGHFQIIDVVDMMEPVTKYSKQVAHGDRIPTIVRQAFKLAEDERPGATHIELPEDVAAEKTTTHPVPIPGKVRRPDANEKACVLAVQMIEQSRNPLILIGAGANRKAVTKMLTLFLEKTGIYFFDTHMGKGVIPEDHSQFLGTAALSSGDYVHCAVERADLIINIGHDVVEKPPFFMEQDGQKVIHINFCPAEVDEVYFPQLEVVGDIANALWQMSEKITPSKAWDFGYFSRVKQFITDRLNEKSSDDRFPLIPQKIVSSVRQVMESDDVLCLDNGMYKIWFARHYPALASNTILLDNALATMGAGLPSAIAAKLVYPDKKVLAVVGDGGFMMNSQELETAVRLKLDLVVLILNDSGYGMIKWKQHDMGFDDFGLDFQNPDFVKYAESYGAQGNRVKSTKDFIPTLQKAFKEGGVQVIDVPVDYSENVALSEELRQKVCLV